MRLQDDFEDASQRTVSWAGGAAVTAGILLALAIAQQAL
jgi:hypothetical protein